MATTFDLIIGHTIKDLRINEGSGLLVFRMTDGKEYAFSAYGDCCNDVWFHHVTLPVNDGLEGCVVLFVEEKGWRDVTPTRQECEEAAFWTLMTTYGYIDIEVRNSHNGYYGGIVAHEENYSLCAADSLTVLTEDF